MLIILEGPEAAGKSTLAEQLHAQTGYPIIHSDKPKTEQDKLHMLMMYAGFIYADKNVILDRCWYSEMVYGNIMRDKSYVDLEQMYHLEKMILENCSGSILIHCTAPVEKLWHRCNVRGEDYVTDIKTLTRIKDGFEYLMHTTAHLIPVTKYEVNENLPSM